MEEAKKYLFFYLDQVWRRRWLALAIAWAVCLIGWSLVSFLPDRFTSEARIYVETQTMLNPLLKGISVRADDPTVNQQLAIMQRTLTSRPNLSKVAQMTDLDKGVNSEAGLQQIIDDLERRISVTNQGTNLFRVAISDNSPAMAKRVVQSLLTIFVENSVGDKREDIQTARSFIETQIEDYESKLKEAEARLADFKIKNIAFLSSNAQTFAARLEQAQMTVKQHESDMNDLRSQRAQLKGQLDATPRFLNVASAPQVVVGDGGTPLQQRIKVLQQRLDALRTQYTPKHPEVVRVEASLAELLAQQDQANSNEATGGVPTDAPRARGEVANELYNQLALRLSEMDSKIASAERRLSDAKQVYDDLQQKTSAAPRIEAEFTALNRDYQVLQTNFQSLLERRESARIAQAADSSTDPVQFRVIAAPEEPAQPDGPPRRLFNLVILIAGLGGGCGLVILLAKVDNCVSTPEDLASFADMGVLGCVSEAVTLGARESFVKRHSRFLAAGAGLGFIFMIVFAVPPNVSALPQKIALALSS